MIIIMTGKNQKRAKRVIPLIIKRSPKKTKQDCLFDF